MGISQRELADAIGLPYQRVNEIVNGHRGVTPSTALRLSRYFGTSSGPWINGQMRWDLSLSRGGLQTSASWWPRSTSMTGLTSGFSDVVTMRTPSSVGVVTMLRKPQAAASRLTRS